MTETRCLRLPLLVLAFLLLLAASANGQTVIEGHSVEVWASPVMDPVDLSAAPDGHLYVGRDLSGSGGSADGATSIHRIAPNGSVSTWGGAIDDPDTVEFDPNGDVGSVGAVLVGGSVATGGPPLESRITEVSAGGSNAVLFGPSSEILNPSGLAIEASGDLLVTDFNQNALFRMTNLVPSVLLSPGLGCADVDVEPTTGNIALSLAGGLIRLYTSSGTLLDSSFGAGRALAYDPFTSPSDLWTVNNATGELLRIAPDGTTAVMGTGFTTVQGMDFGPLGDLYLTEFDNDRVLRVQLPRPSVPSLSSSGVVVLAAGLLLCALTALRTRRTEGCA